MKRVLQRRLAGLSPEGCGLPMGPQSGPGSKGSEVKGWSHGHAFGVRVQKVLKVLRVDSGFTAEGC